ncbi:MAG: 6-bladed beta-propeller [Bacteroidales bacterium]|jgi:hypothetical protein|nr:6-bladed beta-propeller [Bacteroidales bacterium]
MGKLISYSYIVFLFILGACSQKTELAPISLSPQKIISELNDSTFFKTISGMVYHNGKIYLSELSRGAILVLNEDYALTDIIGKKGKGPGEFLFNGHLEVHDDSIWVADINSGVSLFVQNTFIQKTSDDISIFKTRKPIGFFDLRFACHNNYLYYYQLNEQPVILKTNLQTQETQVFAKSEISDKHGKNRGHVITDGENIYVILHNAPFVEKYSLSGEKKEMYDYSDKINFMKTFEYLDAQERQINAVSTLVRDVSFDAPYLYLLLYLKDFSDNLISNKILAINTEDDSDMKLYSLDDGGYYTFITYNHQLFAFDIKNAELKLFMLPK